MTRYDLAVVGLGPAGRALASRAARAGLRVLAVDPHPERRWPQTLAGWSRQLPTWLPDDVIATRTRPVLRTPAERPLSDDYLVLDNTRLQDALRLDGVDVDARLVPDADLGAVPAAVVVDARGVHPAGRPRSVVPAQTAHGLVLDRSEGVAVLAGAESVLMDWRPYDGRATWGSEPPTFLYVLPLTSSGTLVEETRLAGVPPMPDQELRRRLHRRLDRLGLPTQALDGRPVERVAIPLLRRGPRPAPRFGAAGAQLNPVTGYSVFASLAGADAWVEGVRHVSRPHTAGGGSRAGVGLLHRDRPGVVRRTALAALLQLSPDATVSLFDAFARLTPAQQASVLDADTPIADQIEAMGAQWALMPVRHRTALVRATLRGAARGAGLRGAEPG